LKVIGIVGAGGHAREVAFYHDGEVLFYAVTKDHVVDGLTDVENPSDDHLGTPVVVAVGSPGLRRELVAKWPGDNFTNVISSDSHVDPSVVYGKGLQIAPGAIVMPGVILGDHVVINVGATVSHDVRLSDYVTVSPGVHIGGKVRVGEGAYIGLGALVRDNITIGKGVVLGMGAVVTKDALEENGVYLGNPARFVRTNEGWLNEI
jgi:sugar O-acyltransferase (sialic acid O-acetyltransferase NeuD family)